MDFAASEAKKRGQSFPGTAVNLCRKRPGTGQPSPMRPCGEQFAHKGCGCAPPGHTQPGRRKCPICRAASLRGAIRAQRLWICPARSHTSRTEKTPHLPGSQPAGSSSRPKTVDMPRPVTRSRDGENAHLLGRQPAGSNSRTKAMDMSRPASAEGQRHKTKKAPGSDAFLLGADNRT